MKKIKVTAVAEVEITPEMYPDDTPDAEIIEIEKEQWHMWFLDYIKTEKIEIIEMKPIEIYEAETGEKAMYRKGASDYHTLQYVVWLEKHFCNENRKDSDK